MKTLICYHKNCSDGFCAALIAWKNFGDADTKYLSLDYDDQVDLDLMTWPDQIFVLDFYLNEVDLVAFLSSNKRVVVLDHHKTAYSKASLFIQNHPEYVDNFECHFDMNKSGAKLAKEYFLSTEKDTELVDYVEDRDLFKFNLFESKTINAAISVLDKDFNIWNNVLVYWKDYWANKLLSDGKSILQYQETIIESMCKESNIVRFEHTKPNKDKISIPLLNSKILQSDMLVKFNEKFNFDYSGCFFIKGNKVVINLRGKDVNKIAEEFGGGGHVKASGFTIPLKFFLKSIK